MEKNKKTIGIIGYGNMGKAIADKIKTVFDVMVFDKDKAKIDNISGVKTVKAIDSMQEIDALILAVKPQDFEGVLGDVKAIAGTKLIISIAAGISTEYIEKILGKARVIRVMPNLLVKIGKGITALCKGKFATDKDLDFAQKIFDKTGKTLVLEEKMMDADTAFLGSGPGFHFELLSHIDKEKWQEFTENEFIPQCALSGEKVGFPKEQAELLAKLMAEGDLLLLEESKESPQALCILVTSRGGTTEAGLKELKSAVNRLPDAVEAARKRAKELSRR
ncbi:MAG: pyrroline-5-carboxylate reductase [Candidatus Omnitrophica bacterium]|nr:pyrroline-5-carboxylate reductase [Candidatus Omnitrophota bacterium]